jgi:Na+/H+ antiporter NhaD/arsenite permease-like protein
MIAGLAAASFIFGGLTVVSGLLVMALAIFGLLWFAFIRREGGGAAGKIVRGLDWDTALFLAGIFVVVGAVAEVGLLRDFSVFLTRVVGQNVVLGFVLIVAVSTVISGFVDNVPYIIVMLPVARHLAGALSLRPELYMFALLIGSCMGGNLTPFGASANIVAMGILKKQGVPVNFAQWLKIGLPFTLLTTAASSVFVWFIWR